MRTDPPGDLAATLGSMARGAVLDAEETPPATSVGAAGCSGQPGNCVRVAGVGADAQVLNPTVRRGRPPLGKGEGVLLIEDDGRYRVESLD